LPFIYWTNAAIGLRHRQWGKDPISLNAEGDPVFQSLPGVGDTMPSWQTLLEPSVPVAETFARGTLIFLAGR
jgi:hypothetical protein